MTISLAIKKELKQIPIDLLQRGEYQPRQHFDPHALNELAETIKQLGILEPLIVRAKHNHQFEIIAGERRWRAAQIAGLELVPCLVADYSDTQAAQIALIENINRENLNPIEEAQGIARFIEEFQYTHEEAAACMGKTRTEVTNLLRLLKMDSRIQDLLMRGELLASHGKILAGLPFEKQYFYACEVISKGWSIRALENKVKLEQNKKAASQASEPDVNVQRLERQLSDQMGYPTHIALEAQQQGFLKIRFTNLDELDGILTKLGYQTGE